MKIIHLATARVLYIGRKDCCKPKTAFHVLSQPIYFLHAAKISMFFSRNVVYVAIFFSKTGLFTLHIKDELKLKCPTPRPKGLICALSICVEKVIQLHPFSNSTLYGGDG